MVFARTHWLAALLFLGTLGALGGCVEESPTPTPIPIQPTVPRPPLATAAPTLSPVPSPSPSPAPVGRTYTVREGDTLTGIAIQMYGDAEQWRTIFEANRDRLTSADQLQVGQELRIPPLTAR